MRARFLFVAALLALTAACERPPPSAVDATRYDQFWLWPGVAPQPALARARTVYLLDGEVREGARAWVPMRGGVPRIAGKELWLVVRTNRLDWPEGTLRTILARIAAWQAAGNRVAGLQIDFDARTRHLDEYAAFLAELRRQLPARLRLSITGLMDWSAHGDPAVLARLAGTIDEVVIQTYQGRATIPGYQRYFARLPRDFPLNFKVGLVQHGEWTPPPGLEANPRFRGYVVFLVNSTGRAR